MHNAACIRTYVHGQLARHLSGCHQPSGERLCIQVAQQIPVGGVSPLQVDEVEDWIAAQPATRRPHTTPHMLS